MIVLITPYPAPKIITLTMTKNAEHPRPPC